MRKAYIGRRGMTAERLQLSFVMKEPRKNSYHCSNMAVCGFYTSDFFIELGTAEDQSDYSRYSAVAANTGIVYFAGVNNSCSAADPDLRNSESDWKSAQLRMMKETYIEKDGGNYHGK